VDRKARAYPESCGLLVTGPALGGAPPMQALVDVKPVRAFPRLRPGDRCAFSFKNTLKREPDYVLVVWFTDDAGFRWQLDEYLHLVPAGDESEYLP
jgi:hypothetical protein